MKPTRIQCSSCKGKGKQSQQWFPCGLCNGTGKVSKRTTRMMKKFK